MNNLGLWGLIVSFQITGEKLLLIKIINRGQFHRISSPSTVYTKLRRVFKFCPLFISFCFTSLSDWLIETIDQGEVSPWEWGKYCTLIYRTTRGGEKISLVD